MEASDSRIRVSSVTAPLASMGTLRSHLRRTLFPHSCGAVRSDRHMTGQAFIDAVEIARRETAAALVCAQVQVSTTSAGGPIGMQHQRRKEEGMSHSQTYIAHSYRYGALRDSRTAQIHQQQRRRQPTTPVFTFVGR